MKISVTNEQGREVNPSEQYDWLTMSEFIEEYSGNEFTKILKLHNHKNIPDTHMTKTAIYELEKACQNYGACSNCSGISCCMIGIPNPVYNAFEQSVITYDAPGIPDCDEVEADLVWQMKINDNWQSSVEPTASPGDRYRQVYRLSPSKKEAEVKQLPPLIQYLADAIDSKGMKVTFGLQPDDIKLIEDTLLEGFTIEYTFEKVAKQINWDKYTLVCWYVRYLRTLPPKD